MMELIRSYIFRKGIDNFMKVFDDKIKRGVY